MIDINHGTEGRHNPENDQKKPGQSAHKPDGRRQIIAVIFLVIFAIFVMVLWYAQFRRGLSQSLIHLSGQDNNSGLEVCQGPDCQKNDEARLRAQDTDGDGLSDWDELNIYQTSPYLEDSDSDGFADKQEIDSGNDPNCPTGRDCAATISLPAADNNTADNDFEDISDQLNQLHAQSTDTTGAADAFAGLDPAGLRQMLLDAGMDSNVLNQISDDELMKNFQDVLAGN
jgi:hypothetical protein